MKSGKDNRWQQDKCSRASNRTRKHHKKEMDKGKYESEEVLNKRVAARIQAQEAARKAESEAKASAEKTDTRSRKGRKANTYLSFIAVHIAAIEVGRAASVDDEPARIGALRRAIVCGPLYKVQTAT